MTRTRTEFAIADVLRASHDALDVSDGLLIDVIGADGRILWGNPYQLEILGLPLDVVEGMEIAALYANDSAEHIYSLLRSGLAGAHMNTVELDVIGAAGRKVKVLARPRVVVWRGQRALQLTKMELGAVAVSHAGLRDDFTLLRNIVTDATEAHWAIVFHEPVDTTLPNDDVIRQVFENKSVWRMCNRAMARLYHLPDHLDLNSHSVRLFWPRSAENENFVQQIIDANYAIKDALSVDRRLDGTPVYIRNDVSADIEDGFLLRLWGNCRDTTQQTVAEQASAERLAAMVRIIDAIPEPVLFVRRDRRQVGKNKAYLNMFGASAVAQSKILSTIGEHALAKVPKSLTLAAKKAAAITFDIHCEEVPGENGDVWDMIILRRVSARAPRGPSGTAGSKSR